MPKKSGQKYGAIVENFWFVEFIDDMKRGRKRKFLSQNQLAQAVGKSRALISLWEQRRAMPTTPDFLFLCEVLELNPMHYFVIPEEVKK